MSNILKFSAFDIFSNKKNIDDLTFYAHQRSSLLIITKYDNNHIIYHQSENHHILKIKESLNFLNTEHKSIFSTISTSKRNIWRKTILKQFRYTSYTEPYFKSITYFDTNTKHILIQNETVTIEDMLLDIIPVHILKLLIHYRISMVYTYYPNYIDTLKNISINLVENLNDVFDSKQMNILFSYQLAQKILQY
jgi:hypothetical protein